VYAATDNGVFKSTDGAAAWDSCGLSGSVVLDLAIDRDGTGALYAATIADGVFGSADGGASWNPVGQGAGEVPMFADSVAAGRDGALYAGGHSGVYHYQFEEPDRRSRQVFLPWVLSR
jgi:hypothetical protein